MIDGQPIVVQEYEEKREFMHGKGDPVDLYQETLRTIKDAIGPERFLLSSWGTVEEGDRSFRRRAHRRGYGIQRRVVQEQLRLIVTDGGDGIDQDYANWADAYLWR